MSKKIVYKYGTLKVRTIRPSKTTKKHFQVVVKNDRGLKQALKTMHMRLNSVVIIIKTNKRKVKQYDKLLQ
jgi:hypothetical protein